MIRTIGSIRLPVLLLFFGTAWCIQPEIELRVTDLKGDTLQEAQVNNPFVIHVTVSGAERQKLPVAKLDGLDRLHVQERATSSSFSSQNGKTVSRETLHVIVTAPERGHYTIGPARISYDGDVIETETTTVTVGNEQKTIAAPEGRAFIATSVDKKRAYVDEQIILTVRFYYNDQQIRLSHIDEPHFEGFVVSSLVGPRTGSETIDGVKYWYLEWTARLFAQQEGALKVGPIQAHYSLPAARGARSFFDDIADMFGRGRKNKQVVAPAVTVLVDEIPAHEPPAQAIGTFSSLTARTNNNAAGEGEAIVLTLDLVGTGNLERVNHLSVTLPPQLTSYQSSSRIESVGKAQKKSFEYIIQGLQSGEYIIPAQTVTTFDPATQTFNTLTSESVAVNIKTANQATPLQTPEQPSQQTGDQKLLPIFTGGQWKRTADRSLSGMLFVALLMVPFMAVVGWILVSRWRFYRARNAGIIAYRNAFKNARASLKRARQGNYDTQLYHIFMTLFSVRLKIPVGQLSEDTIDQTLVKAGVSEKQLVHWRILFAHMAERAFSSYGTTERNDGIFNQAARWLAELEKIL